MELTSNPDHFATEDCAELTFLEMQGMINDAKRNGFDSAVFVGRNQMKTIMQFAFDNGYISSATEYKCEGDSRPEIDGLKVYLVNIDDYWRVS